MTHNLNKLFFSYEKTYGLRNYSAIFRNTKICNNRKKAHFLGIRNSEFQIIMKKKKYCKHDIR